MNRLIKIILAIWILLAGNIIMTNIEKSSFWIAVFGFLTGFLFVGLLLGPLLDWFISKGE